MNTNSSKHEGSGDGLENAFAQIFNDPAPPKDDSQDGEAKESAVPVMTPPVSLQSDVDLSRSPNLTPAHLASRPASEQWRASTKSDSQAVRNLANAAALRQSSTRLGDFDNVPRVDSSELNVSASQPAKAVTPLTPPPLPGTNKPQLPIQKPAQKLATQSADADDFNAAMRESRLADESRDKKLIGATAVFLLFLTVRGCNLMREPNATIENELTQKINTQLRRESKGKVVSQISLRPQDNYEKRSGIYRGTIYYSDLSEKYFSAKWQGTDIWGRPKQIEYEVN